MRVLFLCLRIACTLACSFFSDRDIMFKQLAATADPNRGQGGLHRQEDQGELSAELPSLRAPRALERRRAPEGPGGVGLDVVGCEVEVVLLQPAAPPPAARSRRVSVCGHRATVTGVRCDCARLLPKEIERAPALRFSLPSRAGYVALSRPGTLAVVLVLRW